MKKKIIGVTLAALLLGGSIGFAAASSPLIGAKVQGLFAVEQNGKKIADAVIINGSAYAPVRAISEATGTALAIEGKKIIMGNTVETSQTIGGSTQVEPIATAAPAVTLTQEEKDILTRRITNGERGLVASQEDLAQAQAALVTTTDETEIQRLKKSIAELENRITGAQKALDADKARLSAAGE